MITFQSITMRNFLSYGNNTTTVLLDRPNTTTLIVGEDLDNTADGKGANGVGKTAIINALTYAVYDTPISNISKDNLVNNINKKNMEVIVEFTMSDSDRYIIKRSRKMKAGAAGNTVYLYKNNIDITPDSANATNALIQKIIGIPYELFTRIVVFSAAHTPFLDLKVADQAAMIEELFGLTMLSEKATSLKEMIRETETKIGIQQALIGEREKEKAQYNKQVESAQQRIHQWEIVHEQNLKDGEKKKNQWVTNIAEQIRDARHKIERFEQDRATILIQFRKKLSELEQFNFDVEQQLHETISQLVITRDSKVVHQREIAREKVGILAKMKTNEDELTHLRDDKCPRCLQSMPNAADEITKCEQHSNDWINELEGVQEHLHEVTTSITELNTELETLRNDLKVPTIKDLVGFRLEKTRLVGQIQNKEQEINPHLGRDIINDTNPYVDSFEKLKLETNPHLSVLEELLSMQAVGPDYTDMNTLKTLGEHQQFLLKLLTKKDSFIRKALLNRNIPHMNSRLQHYLSLIGLPHKVEFTHEMTAKITQIGRELDFGNLSAGQAARVNFALALAFRDVLQGRHTKINVCMLDEVLDHGLDSIGVQAAAHLLKRKARDEGLSLYITSHRDEIDRAFDHTMTVQMSGGFSYILET